MLTPEAFETIRQRLQAARVYPPAANADIAELLAHVSWQEQEITRLHGLADDAQLWQLRATRFEEQVEAQAQEIQRLTEDVRLLTGPE